MPRTVLEVGGITDIGMVRTRNEDYMGTLTIPDEALYATKGQLFIVCDGMGGHAAGNVASRMAVEKVNQTYYYDNFSPNPGENMEYAIKIANKEIFEEASRNPEYFRMGTTFVGIIVFGDEAYVANVGDSRGYMVRGEDISQVTKDHSWVALQVEMGEMTQEEAESSQNRSILLRCLGEKPDVLVDSKVLKLQKGDTFILCSDGLHGLVANDEIKLRATEMDAQSACQALVDLANSRGGHDNVTVMVVRVKDVFPPDKPAPPRREERVRLPSEVSAQSGGGGGTAVAEAAPPVTAPPSTVSESSPAVQSQPKTSPTSPSSPPQVSSSRPPAPPPVSDGSDEGKTRRNMMVAFAFGALAFLAAFVIWWLNANPQQEPSASGSPSAIVSGSPSMAPSIAPSLSPSSAFTPEHTHKPPKKP